MHTIGTLYAQSITADRISHATAQRAAREASRASSPRGRKPRLHLRRARRAVPSV
jgi:hypothetical protein